MRIDRFGSVSKFFSRAHRESRVKCSSGKDEKRERVDRNFSQEVPSRNGAHLSLPAARFRSLTVKRREEAARETEADPLPMVALDFAGLAVLREFYVGRYSFFIARYFRNEFVERLMQLNVLSLIIERPCKRILCGNICRLFAVVCCTNDFFFLRYICVPKNCKLALLQ